MKAGKKTLAYFALTLGALAFFSCSASAKTVRPLPVSCVSSFYDPNEYNWLSFKNLCSQAISLTIVSRKTLSSGVYNVGTLDISVGGHQSTGFSRSEINSMGGYSFYVCPLHSMPVNSNNRQIFTPNTLQLLCPMSGHGGFVSNVSTAAGFPETDIGQTIFVPANSVKAFYIRYH